MSDTTTPNPFSALDVLAALEENERIGFGENVDGDHIILWAAEQYVARLTRDEPVICDECGASYPAGAISLVGKFHAESCSLYPNAS